MKTTPRAIVKNAIVAVTLCVAAVATWAVTQSSAPTIVVVAQAANG
jgi:hypothetical protein